jgi:SAM-dependent methyltransferase
MKVRARDHYARPFRRRGRLLDVGCGAGETLKAWLRQHERCVAVEPDPGAAEAARRTLGIEVRTGRLEEQAFAPASFDAITLSHVLEHAVDPRAVLARAAQWLVPGGEILVWVPNFGSLFRPLFGAGWFPYEVPRHRWHFRPEDLARLLREAGLALVEVAPDPNEHPFRASARRSSPPLSFILSRRAVRILCLLIGRLFRRSDVLRFRAIKPAPHGPASALASERSTSAAARSQL